MEEHAKTGTRPSSRFCVLHVWCQTPTMYYSWNDISAPGYCSVWAEYRQSQCQAGILNFLFAKLMNCYLYVLRDTPSRGQCFQLCPGRWFQPCSPHIPWASSCSLFAGKKQKEQQKTRQGQSRFHWKKQDALWEVAEPRFAASCIGLSIDSACSVTETHQDETVRVIIDTFSETKSVIHSGIACISWTSLLGQSHHSCLELVPSSLCTSPSTS